MTEKKIPAKQGSNTDYEVGYKKPPKHTRFKPGQSGNPRGRGASNFAELRAKAMRRGHELAYTAAGKPIIWNGEHLTWEDLVILSWLSDKKYMHEWRDTAHGKPRDEVDLTSGGEKLQVPQIIEIIKTYEKPSDETN